MKQQLLLPLFFFSLATSTFAQHKSSSSKKMKGDLSVGYSRYFGQPNISNGALISFGPKYSVIDKFAVGLRLELVALAQEGDKLYHFASNDQQVTFKLHNSLLLTGDYYLTDNKTRPFIGAGAGLHIINSNPFQDSKRIETKFGEMIRAGVDVNRFHLAVEYNFVPKTIINAWYDAGGERNFYTSRYSNSYLGVKLGFCFGAK